MNEKKYARSMLTNTNFIVDLQAILSNEVIIAWSIKLEEQILMKKEDMMFLSSTTKTIMDECNKLFDKTRFYALRDNKLQSCVCFRGTAIIDALKVVDIELSRLVFYEIVIS
jgi:hypothetical protein